MNAKRIEGAVALVTGANRGIGRALTIEAGQEDIFPDPFSLDSPKALERQCAAMAAAMLSGSAA